MGRDSGGFAGVGVENRRLRAENIFGGAVNGF
jgi:hypothetical protein